MSKKLSISIQRKIYPGTPEVQALSKIDFQIEPEEFVCIVGPSGCGKSTLLRMIVGIEKEFDGKIVLGDRVIREPEKDCGIVFQEPRLLPWQTVEQNIAFGIYDSNKNAQYTKQVTELINLLGLQDFSKSYPNQLSGGMSQKVALARALINLPDLLLLDEPFASLDAITKMKLQDELAKVLKAEKTTVLMVTHDIEEAVYLADRIMVMSQRPGEILRHFAVTLPKPRQRTSEAFEELHGSILRYMSEELKLF